MRDMDLIRTILLEMEKLSEDGPKSKMDAPLFENLQGTGYSQNKVAHHIELLYQAGLIDGVDFGKSFGSKDAGPTRNI